MLDQTESNLVTITGGEPLLQKEALEELCQKLHKKGFNISIETNGSIVPPKSWQVSWVVDYKLPLSGVNHYMIPAHQLWPCLRHKDFIKMVVWNTMDLNMALELMDTNNTSATFAISPVMGEEGSLDLVKTIIKGVQNSGIVNKHNVILNVQLHKLLNLQEPH
jgi:7-carboxy-7-deazaguanine synthase